VEKSFKYFFIFLLIFVFFFAFSTNLPKRQRGGFFSDGGAYFPIISSLAYDFDLEYTRQDYLRVKERFDEGPMGLFLKKVPNGKLYYAKSFAYPLLAAPFFRLFDVNGLLLLNGLMIFLSIYMSFLLLRQYHSQKKSFQFSLIFLLASVMPIYIWWVQADLFNFFMMFAGLFFFFYKFKNSRWVYLSALFFSLAAFSKLPNVVAIGVIYLILLYRKEWKKFIISGFIFLLVFSGLAGFYFSQTGETLNYKMFMGGERQPFLMKYPFEKPEYTFESNKSLPKMSADNFWERFYISPRILVMNSFYYFFGRFTGMFIYYFSAFFVLILFIFQRKSREDWFVLAAIIFSILFYLIVTSGNYFGGGGSVGNRYFLSIFPLFFFLGHKNRIFKFSLLPVFAALIFLSGTFLDGHHHSATARLTGISFPQNLFPPEKTQYQPLPTNEDPRAFGKIVGRGENKYWLYFLNDNFNKLEGDQFWTDGTKKMEVFLVSQKRVKKFEILLENNRGKNIDWKSKNKVWIKLEHHKKVFLMKADTNHKINFKNISGLKIKNKYIYYFQIKCSEYYCPFFEDPGNDDRRKLGVRIQIGLIY